MYEDFYYEIQKEEIKFSSLPVVQNNIIEVEAEEIKQGFEWEVVGEPIYNKHGYEIEGYKLLTRSDNNQMLNVCKNSYTPTENRLFVESAYRLEEISGFVIDSFQELKNGCIVLAYLRNPAKPNICGHEFKNFMILGNSHNYQSAFFIGEHNTMLRCSNQFHRVKQNLKAYHTSGNENQVKRLIEFFTQFKAIHQTTANLMQALEMVSINGQIKDSLIRHLMDIKPETPLKELSSRKLNLVDSLYNSIDRETKELGNNLFGLFNGVTHYTTHARKEKEKVYSQFFGSSAEMNNKALQFCADMIE